MRVFLDTNVFIEYFAKRTQFAFVRQILSAIEDGEVTGVLSAGSFYTIAYAMEMELKRAGIHNPEKLQRNRVYLNRVLDLVQIANAGDEDYRLAVNDEGFKDLEDSFQYRNALAADCDVLITINVSDFRGATKIKVLSPDEYVKQYLS